MQATPAEEARSADVEAVIEAFRQHRVGGNYWLDRPELPDRYVLVRSAQAAESLSLELSDEPLLFWNPKGTAAVGAENGHAVVTRGCDPWHMVARASRVIVDADDEVALAAALSGVRVCCIGHGRFEALCTPSGNGLRSIIEDMLLHSCFRDPFSGERVSAEEAIALCGFWRRLIDGNRRIGAALGCASWKRSTIAPLLWPGSERLRFTSKVEAIPPGAEVAVWRSRTPAAALRKIEAGNVRALEIEDGFIRSAGLGADCIPPLSIVVDRSGIYFDPRRPSDLEDLLETGPFGPELIDRARTLRHIIVSRGITKYAVGEASFARRSNSPRQILVPGQVEDDRAVLCGLGPATNLELLQRVRAEAPEAHIIYKPHPDVEAGHRLGKIEDRICLQSADEVVRDVPISAVISEVDEVHVNTSLAGFEALMREKTVVTYGVPFYAGWGLTSDRGPVPSRRSAKRTLDELVAASLLVYPRYLDPITGLPCPPEVLVSRLSQPAPEAPGLLVRLRRLQGALRRRVPGLRR